ncbi:arabinogalactan endo-1,4-beta-galactosidase [Peribacillus muralis]|nr:glycosyl hydrolase 53 family protein [Peribacillus muralis]MCK1991054.1 glycosyl hydrolase 53 family protein [Peribacillus muralis]MCK2011608.1 glycosyl hydrolase 53 family protein [Peribacillus muralis]
MFKKQVKRFLVIVMGLSLALTGFASFDVSHKAEAATAFAYGADIGWMKQMEDEGVSWVDDNGKPEDALQILKDHGINSVRLRVFVNPPSDYYWLKDGTTWTMLGYSDKAGVLAAAKRAKALGMRIMVDFHYSDVFADPGHQTKPNAWTNYTNAQLQTAVYNHTYDVMSELKSNGIYPDWVQVGNEMNSGIMLPDGSTDNFSKLTAFLNKGYDAVKAVSPASKVVSHLAHGTNNSQFKWWFDNFFSNGGKTDVIGASFYPYWDGQPYWEITDELSYNLNDMASRYSKEVMVVEVGGDEKNPKDSYWTINDTIKVVKAVPNGKGIGVFYWEPQAHSSVLSDGYSLGATTEVSTNVLKYTTAIDAFSDAAKSSSSGNLVNNPGFETDAATQNPSGWTTWSNANDTANYTEAGGYSGSYRLTHWNSTAYQVSTHQIKTGLTNGTYTMKAWVKSSGGFKTSQMFVKNFGGSEKNAPIPTTNTWTQMTITDINVTNGQAEFGFWTDANANKWINVDNVEFFKN